MRNEIIIAFIASLLCTSNVYPENETTTAPQAGTHARTGKLDPSAVEHYNRAVELHQKGFLNQAISEYRAAVDADDRLQQAWSNMGGVYMAQRKDDEALAAFQKAMALNPKSPVTLSCYGQSLYNVGRFKEAVETWKQTLDLDPKFKSCAYSLATALRKLGHPAEAEDVINKYGLAEKDGELVRPAYSSEY
jgi:tetratricopeptide (TPR) repeat protein